MVFQNPAALHQDIPPTLAGVREGRPDKQQVWESGGVSLQNKSQQTEGFLLALSPGLSALEPASSF